MDAVRAEEIRHTACSRKVAFDSMSAGWTEAKRNKPADAHGHPKQRPYHCPFCQKFHVGRVPSIATVREIAAAIRWFGTGYEGD